MMFAFMSIVASPSLVSRYLKAINFFIPTYTVVNDILAAIEERSIAITTENAIRIVKTNGAIKTTNKSAGATLPSSVDLWGETWTTTAINDVDFGIVIATIRAGILSGKTIEAISAGRCNSKKGSSFYR